MAGPLDTAFPTASWPGIARTVTFYPYRVDGSDYAIPAVVVFAWTGSGFLLADIAGRGWCTPSGRLEPGESVESAAVRETLEETGAVLQGLTHLGVFRLESVSGEVSSVPLLVGRVVELGIPAHGTESLGVREVTLDALPGVYYRWDALLEQVFEYAQTESLKLFSRPRKA